MYGNKSCQALFFLCEDMKPYTMILQRMGDNDAATIIDTEKMYNIACTSTPFLPFSESKDVFTRDWPEEDGEDVYINAIKRKAYDWEIGLCYKGEAHSAYEWIMYFLHLLLDRDDRMKIGYPLFRMYFPYLEFGRKGVYLKKFSEDSLYIDRDENIVTFSMTFRVTDPVTTLVPVMSGDNITGFTEKII